MCKNRVCVHVHFMSLGDIAVAIIVIIILDKCVCPCVRVCENSSTRIGLRVFTCLWQFCLFDTVLRRNIMYRLYSADNHRRVWQVGDASFSLPTDIFAIAPFLKTLSPAPFVFFFSSIKSSK